MASNENAKLTSVARGTPRRRGVFWVLRFWNDEVVTNIEGVLEAIARHL